MTKAASRGLGHSCLVNRVEKGGCPVPGLSSAGFEPTDAIAPHVNTYSILLNPRAW